MTPIQLTEEHKSKLLEMCKVLFPETHTKTWDIDEFIDYEPINDEDFQCFHWFEFCVNHLSKKVFTIEGELKAGYEYFINNTRFTKKHPIDYLYEEFKKLKQ